MERRPRTFPRTWTTWPGRTPSTALCRGGRATSPGCGDWLIFPNRRGPIWKHWQSWSESRSKSCRSARTASRRSSPGKRDGHNGRLIARRPDMPASLSRHRAAAPGRVAVRFILVSAGVYAVCLSLAAALIRLLPSHGDPGQVVFPPAFYLTTALLAAGSGALQHAVRCVRLERQKPFRRSLLAALVSGVLFVSFQICGLLTMIRNQVPDDVQTGAN